MIDRNGLLYRIYCGLRLSNRIGTTQNRVPSGVSVRPRPPVSLALLNWIENVMI
jgi:hypothetical protein